MQKEPATWKQGDKGDVLFVHGFSEGWPFLAQIGNYINTLGFRIHVVKEINHNFETIEEESIKVKKYIETHQLENYIIIGYSKGGLIATYLLSQNKIDNVKKIITIATPFNGTILGKLQIFNLWQLQPGSKILKELQLSSEENSKIVSFRSQKDNLIIPHTSPVLEGVKNIEIPVIGHTWILYSAALKTEITKELQA